jgi:hypothetical protein
VPTKNGRKYAEDFKRPGSPHVHSAQDGKGPGAL